MNRYVRGSGFGRLAAVALLLGVCATSHGTIVEEDMAWTGGLRSAYFGDRAITQSDDIITLAAPKRAENAAIVPISIKANISQTEERYIKTIYVVVDQNPGPLVGTFRFTPKSGVANLDFRIRVNAYSPVRAIAETNDGQLYMSRRYVKGSGGCSAPAGADMDAAMARLGRMKLKVGDDTPLAEPAQVQLMVSHPNSSGMQMDQVSQLYAPAHFVRNIAVAYKGENIFSAETSFAISENPNFKFYFVPDGEGELTAEIVDTNDLTFSKTLQVSRGTGPSLAGN